MKSKEWYQSITIWASGAVVFLQGLPAIIAEIDKALPWDLAMNPIVIKVLTISSAIVAIWGRLRAFTAIK